MVITFEQIDGINDAAKKTSTIKDHARTELKSPYKGLQLFFSKLFFEFWKAKAQCEPNLA